MNNRIEEILKETGALLNGHFLLSSGRHGNQYMQCAKILQRPRYAAEMTEPLAGAFAGDGVDLVLSPAVGGIIVGYELARQLDIENMFAERENGVMTLRRGFVIEPGSRILIAENVITTGGTVREVMKIADEMGAETVGVAVLVDRSMGGIDFGVKLRAAYTADIKSWEAENCPLCHENHIPLVKPGSRNI
ncbi:MAG: orotate phosphoribosyltransferase [Clostridiales bacterium]|jgi:orotate phosphoribosyltransferase|nr:orotate phosphoribosyltransferase [Clostridiales bacterium]